MACRTGAGRGHRNRCGDVADAGGSTRTQAAMGVAGGRRAQQREREREQGGTQLVSDQQVIDAIRRGVNYLLQSKQRG